ncbi:hypothetical protein QA640_47065 (plasmid) [Bradyrhizobium sp. CB82]|uniref:hypothetical protein n=1 Tax=Bradyrhizobium sp. CB82 TaxID=3039159 RepID=UPI0024B2248F|nr:hypothetical protein [Bradyrhizobium sp. CB82]WFU45566.1 hypothetical protein QA640_47065 [Bradyrhizobium sp. CB82]
MPDLVTADGTPFEKFALKKLRRKMKPIFKTSVHRITLPVRTKRSETEHLRYPAKRSRHQPSLFISGDRDFVRTMFGDRLHLLRADWRKFT